MYGLFGYFTSALEWVHMSWASLICKRIFYTLSPKADVRLSEFLAQDTRTRNLVQEDRPCVISPCTSFFLE